MKFGYAILATALLISITAEYYSIMGLTAIFAAATSSVIIMGVSLGLGKVVATVWCHNNWARIPLSFKLYLVPAIAFLMILTSLGTFGFLSKAHLEQSTNTGEAIAQVQLYDEKIRTQQENIESARAGLKQLDATVNLTLDRSTDTGSVVVASSMRKRQAKERADLQRVILEAQKEISTLQTARAPLAMEARKIEAEVGPIKYIAALIYGDSPDNNLLERAVRWVIILIVAVFDPLALCLILAANKQFAWAREDRKRALAESFDRAASNFVQAEQNAQQMVASLQPAIDTVFTNGEMASSQIRVAAPVTGEDAVDVLKAANILTQAGQLADDYADPNKATPTPEEHGAHVSAAEEEPLVEVVEPKLTDTQKFWAAGPQAADKPKRTRKPVTKKATAKKPRVVKPREEAKPIIDMFTAQLTAAKESLQEAPATIPTIPDLLNITDEAPPKMVEVVTEIVDPNTRIKTFAHNWVPADSVITADNVPDAETPAANFGTVFPARAKKGDTYLRVDYLPPRLYKFNGANWMEVSRNSSDSIAYNDEYIKYLIEKLNSGEYDVENLTATEEEQIAEYLSRNFTKP